MAFAVAAVVSCRLVSGRGTKNNSVHCTRAKKAHLAEFVDKGAHTRAMPWSAVGFPRASMLAKIIRFVL